MTYQTELFNGLTALVASDESFYSKDLRLDGRVFRVFNYRLASWTSFQKPFALECRGTLFDVTAPEYPKLVSLPPAKFFNVEEGNGLESHLGNTIRAKMVKLDGSLISTYMHGDELRLKSKASLDSEQAVRAMEFLKANPAILAEVKHVADCGFTLSFEYTSPTNRVVVGYDETKLTVLMLRDNETGETIVGHDLHFALDTPNGVYKNLKNMIVDAEYPTNKEYSLDFVEQIRKEQEGEGYVVELMTPTGKTYMVKIKNEKYITLHRTKDSITSEKRLFECVLDEATDDLRSMFSSDQHCLNMIDAMEKKVIPIYNHLVFTVDDFFAENGSLERKDYAIKASKDYPDLMGLMMARYLGKKPQFKDFAKKNREEIFGIGDATLVGG